MAETDYGRACSAASGCTYSNLHCTYPECIWGRAVARSRTTDRRPIDPAVAELVEALRTVQLARINGLFDAAIEHQIAGDVDGVFAEVDAALAKHAAKP